jgi:putative transposase
MYRFYPTDKQKQRFARTFGRCRDVSNRAVRERTDAYYQQGKRLYYKNPARRLVLLKQAEYPPFQMHRLLPNGYQPGRVTITKEEAERYVLSILIKEGMKSLAGISRMIGLDPGLKSLVSTSNGQTCGNPQCFYKAEKNRVEARLNIAKRSRDYQHKLSTQIIREHQVVCVESLQARNHPRAKAIRAPGWSECVRQLEYKAGYDRRTLVKSDKWYSSWRWFDCGHILDSFTPDVRERTRPSIMTALSMPHKHFGRGLTVAACGEHVRPGALKQESLPVTRESSQSQMSCATPTLK